jgi:hypothetical protein
MMDAQQRQCESPTSVPAATGLPLTISGLPYNDTKPQGAADFYFAINATFRFIQDRLGQQGWITYLRQLGARYFAPVNDSWRQGGLPAVAGYWRAFFAAEPGGAVEVREEAGTVVLDIGRCPAIHHLKTHAREIVPSYCEHCYHLGQARAEAAGMALRLEGGDGQCRHVYFAHPPETPQDMSAIRAVTSC